MRTAAPSPSVFVRAIHYPAAAGRRRPRCWIRLTRHWPVRLDAFSVDRLAAALDVAQGGRASINPDARELRSRGRNFCGPCSLSETWSWLWLNETRVLASRRRRVGVIVGSFLAVGVVLIASFGLLSAASVAAGRRVLQSSATGGGELCQQARIGAPRGAARGFGRAVAASRSVVVVAALSPSRAGVGAYVYVRRADGSFGRRPTARLFIRGRAEWMKTVAISGDTIVIGDPYSHVGANVGQGAAYVFVRPQGGWRDEHQTATLTFGASDTHFGFAVGIWGDTIVATSGPGTGKAGAAYVFRRPAGGWESSVMPIATVSSPRSVSGLFGTSVAIDATTIAVGDPGSGQIDVYTRTARDWKGERATARLTASADQRNDQLGQTIAMHGNAIAATTQIRGPHPGYWYNAIDVFTQSRHAWRDDHQAATLTPQHESESNDIGFSLAIDGSRILAGAPDGGVGRQETGNAYLFSRPAGGWNGEHSARQLDGQTPTAAGRFRTGRHARRPQPGDRSAGDRSPSRQHLPVRRPTRRPSVTGLSAPSRQSQACGDRAGLPD